VGDALGVQVEDVAVAVGACVLHACESREFVLSDVLRAVANPDPVERPDEAVHSGLSFRRSEHRQLDYAGLVVQAGVMQGLDELGEDLGVMRDAADGRKAADARAGCRGAGDLGAALRGRLGGGSLR
jgi:hypothetical protein